MITFKTNRIYIEADYEPFISRNGSRKLEPLPNAEDVDPLKFLNTLAAGGHSMDALWGYALLPGETRQQWTQFFLTHWMAQDLDGGGYAVTYNDRAPIVRHFAICKHQKVDAPGANHSRGWHPGYCEICGMNMTYDSGD